MLCFVAPGHAEVDLLGTEREKDYSSLAGHTRYSSSQIRRPLPEQTSLTAFLQQKRWRQWQVLR